MWQTHKRARRAREQRGRSQTSELFLFVEIQKWSCYPGGSSCFPYSSATWQASTRGSFTLSPLPASDSFLSPLASSPTSRPSSLYPPTILLSPPAGKRSWPAVETAWLRRRPSRCTGDKFVCVSWAATLGGRTLTRSCQWEGKSRPSTSSAHLLLGRPPYSPSYCLHAWLPQQPSKGQRGGQAPWSQDFPLGSQTPPPVSLTPPVCTVEVPQTHLHTQSKLHREHNRSPR